MKTEIKGTCYVCKKDVPTTETVKRCVLCNATWCGTIGCNGEANIYRTTANFPTDAPKMPFICKICWDKARLHKVSSAPAHCVGGGDIWACDLGRYARMVAEDCNKIFIDKMVKEIERMKNE